MSEGRASELIEEAQVGWQRVQRLRPVRAFSHFIDVGGNVLSAGMSYQAMFAVFAGLWVGFSVFGAWLRSRPELLETLVDQLNHMVPGLLGDDGIISVDTLLGASGLDWTSVLAGASLLWVAITWFTGTRRAIRIIFGLEVKQYRNAALLKLRDFALALVFLAVLLVSAGLTVASTNLTEVLFEWLGVDPSNWLLGTLGGVVRYAAMYAFDVLVLIAIHRFLAEVRVPIWSVIHGSAIGGIVLFVLKLLGALLLDGAGSNPLLASFAVIVGLLIWFNLVCRTLLLTASWIAVGQDRTLGLPEPVLST